MHQALRYFNAWRRLGLLLLAVDVYLSLAPAAGGTSVMPDKLAHFLVYFVIAFWFSSLYPRAIPWVFAGAAVLGGALELLQGLGEVRHAEWLDVLANTAGAALACVMVHLMPANVFRWIERTIPVRAP